MRYALSVYRIRVSSLLFVFGRCSKLIFYIIYCIVNSFSSICSTHCFAFPKVSILLFIAFPVTIKPNKFIIYELEPLDCKTEEHFRLTLELNLIWRCLNCADKFTSVSSLGCESRYAMSVCGPYTCSVLTWELLPKWFLLCISWAWLESHPILEVNLDNGPISHNITNVTRNSIILFHYN